MVKQDIIEHLTYNCGLRRDSAIRAVEGVIGAITGALANGESVSIRGLGTLKVIGRAEKIARNISAGTSVTVPAHRTVKFIPSQMIKETLK